jgi:hypothetical protein
MGLDITSELLSKKIRELKKLQTTVQSLYNFDENTLPDEIKTKMAMILASPKQIAKDEDISLLELMSTPIEEGYREIGWRTSDTYFIVVLTYKTLCLLRGGIVDGETL